MEYLKIHINNYIDCVINDCDNLPNYTMSRLSSGQFLNNESRNKILPVLDTSWDEHFD